MALHRRPRGASTRSDRHQPRSEGAPLMTAGCSTDPKGKRYRPHDERRISGRIVGLGKFSGWRFWRALHGLSVSCQLITSAFSAAVHSRPIASLQLRRSHGDECCEQAAREKRMVHGNSFIAVWLLRLSVFLLQEAGPARARVMRERRDQLTDPLPRRFLNGFITARVRSTVRGRCSRCTYRVVVSSFWSIACSLGGHPGEERRVDTATQLHMT